MRERPAAGKLTPGAFAARIAPHLGVARDEVLVGPRPGHDAAIVRIGPGRALALTTDPLSIVPAWGIERSARNAAHLVASDLWTSGIPPAYASVTLNLPESFPDTDLERFAAALGAAWSELGVSVVTGHTGRYAGIGGTIVGAATVMGVGDESGYLAPSMARPGDRVLVTKGFAFEATAVAAHLCPRRLAARLTPGQIARAQAMADHVSVVAECRAALRVGVHERGVTAMHDATEGGVLGGLVELARGCGHDLRIARARIPLSEEARAACGVFGIDPGWALSQGALIATVRPAHAAAVRDAIASEGIAVAEVGDVASGHGELWLTGEGGTIERIREPLPDPYWDAYARAVREGWE